MPKIGFKINPTTMAPTTMDFEHGGSSTNAACASSSDMAVGGGDARASGRVGTRIVTTSSSGLFTRGWGRARTFPPFVGTPSGTRRTER